jgi:hypothetical protein
VVLKADLHQDQVLLDNLVEQQFLMALLCLVVDMDHHM